MAGEQVENFISEANKLVGGDSASAQNQPKVPFQTQLRLTADQEQKMIEHAFTRKKQVENETGRDLTMNPIWWNNQTWGASVALQSQGLLPVGDTFMGKRSRYDATYNCDVSWRPFTMGPATIFQDSNITVPLSRRIATQMIAKAKDRFLSVDPWFTLGTQPVVEHDAQNDAERDDRIEKFCQFKFRESDAKDNYGDAISAAIVFGEAPVKTSYVVRDQIFNCYGPGTEILTENGWILVEEWTAGKVATMNLSTGVLEYQEPTNKISQYVDGDMIRIKTRSQELLVTPDHRMVVRERRKKNDKTTLHRCVKSAANLNVFDMIVTHVDGWSGSDEPLVLPATDKLPARAIDRRAAARAIGWFVTEGCAFLDNKKARTPVPVVCLSQNPGPKQDIMLRDFEALGWKLKRSSDRQYRTFDKQAFAFFSECGKWAKNKKVPAWIKKSSREALLGFMETAILGDGHSRPSGYRMICTISKQLADDYAEIAVKLGIRPKVTKYAAKPYKIGKPIGTVGTNTQPQYWVGLCTADGISLRDERNNPRFYREKYTGMVHCLTVPNGTLVVRYKGGVMICGNCESTVLHDVTGQPVRATDGNYITQEDQFVDSEDGTGRRVLARDKQTEEPSAPIWQTAQLDRRQVLFEGAKSEVIYFKDFLCPITAPDVQQADFVAHLYDKSVMEFVDLVVKRGMVGDTAPDRVEAAQRMLALVKQLASNSPQPKAAASQELRPNDHYATSPSVETGGPVAEFMECYLWFDANGDGIAENIMLIVDRNTKAPIFYDHVANVTTDGLRPIEIVRVNPVRGRWYGIGILEKFEPYQTLIDLLVNRWNFSQSRAGRVDLWTPNNTLEGDRDPTLKMNWGGTYTKKPGMKAEDVLQSVYLTDVKFEQVHEMIEFFLQLAYNESGVMTANDGQAAGAQSTDLATGIIETTRSGDELFKPIEQDLQGPLQRLLEREVSVTLANINPTEVFTFLEGDTMGIDHITPDDVRGLKYKARITLTNQKNQEAIQMSAAASALVEKFYLLTPEVQEKTAPFYRAQIRILAPTVDANMVIDPVKPAEPAPEPTKSGVNLTIKWETLTPEEKQLFAARIGVDDQAPTPAVEAAPSGGKKSGSGEKLGVTKSSGANAASPAQLMQRNSQPTGKSAPGGTPAK